MTNKINAVKTPQLIYDEVKTVHDLFNLSHEDLQNYALALNILYNQAREELTNIKAELAKLDKEILAPITKRHEKGVKYESNFTRRPA